MTDNWGVTFMRDEVKPGEAGSVVPSPLVLHPGAAAYLRAKAVAEWVAALALLVLALPVLTVLAIVLKRTSEGPVFYRQMRLGQNGRPFFIHKLRTMTNGCEAVTGPVWSIAGDPRVTRVGRWLRDTHMDELPQLWNVLRGEMSLIGPRPERPAIAEKIERAMPEFRDRLLVRPGMTGLAQMRLPPDSNFSTVRQKLAHDLQYIRHVGPALDILIAVSTVLHLVGMTVAAVSNQLVQPYAPESPIDTSTATPEPDLRVCGHQLHLVPAPSELSHAA